MTKIEQLLGDKAAGMLGFNNPKIARERLHLPGPDVIDRLFSVTTLSQLADPAFMKAATTSLSAAEAWVGGLPASPVRPSRPTRPREFMSWPARWA